MVGCSFRGRAWLFEVPLLCQGLCTVPLKFSSGCEEVNGEHRLFRCLVVARCRMVQRWDTRACFLQSARWRGYAWRKWSGLQFAPRLHCVAPVLAIQSLRMCANRFVYWYQRSNRFVFCGIALRCMGASDSIALCNIVVAQSLLIKSARCSV